MLKASRFWRIRRGTEKASYRVLETAESTHERERDQTKPAQIGASDGFTKLTLTWGWPDNRQLYRQIPSWTWGSKLQQKRHESTSGRHRERRRRRENSRLRSWSGDGCRRRTWRRFRPSPPRPWLEAFSELNEAGRFSCVAGARVDAAVIFLSEWFLLWPYFFSLFLIKFDYCLTNIRIK